VWAADVTYAFPDVQYFALHGLDRPLFIPASAGPKIAADKWRHLDERNALVERTPQGEWAAFVERARPFVEEPRAGR
jgi:hypothetical protein